MKARIEKKLSKRLVQLHPAMYRTAWRDDEQSELAYEQGSKVRHCLSVGGGTDYWGEGLEAYTVWADWRNNWSWYGHFESYPEGHEFESYPDTGSFRPTTKNLLRLAADCELGWRAKGRPR
ncbi:hypothetical protein [Pseudomonas fluorescens]|uniref:hypothetical protein n=1 Tax=Pseudomonas fluorescens TaxID=294 RepID=UPI0007D06040|nr:hypothetical protein [Pseudomonas fluorescens]